MVHWLLKAWLDTSLPQLIRLRYAFSLIHPECPIFFIFLSLAGISHMQVLWLHNLTKQVELSSSSTHLDVSAPPGLEDDMSDSISSRAATQGRESSSSEKMTWKCSNQSNQHNNELYNTWPYVVNNTGKALRKMRKSLLLSLSHVWTFLFGVDCNGSIKVTRWLASLFTLEPIVSTYPKVLFSAQIIPWLLSFWALNPFESELLFWDLDFGQHFGSPKISTFEKMLRI